MKEAARPPDIDRFKCPSAPSARGVQKRLSEQMASKLTVQKKNEMK